MNWKMIRLFSVVMAAVFLSGCSVEVEKPAGMPELYPCTLTLTQQGQPLVGATVQVLSSESTWSAGSITDEQGKALLVTYGKFHGVQAGKHKVTVNKREADNPEIDPNTGLPVIGNGRSSLPKTFTLVEKKYTSEKTTPLELEILPGQNNDQTFECGALVREQL